MFSGRSLEAYWSTGPEKGTKRKERTPGEEDQMSGIMHSMATLLLAHDATIIDLQSWSTRTWFVAPSHQWEPDTVYLGS